MKRRVPNLDEFVTEGKSEEDLNDIAGEVLEFIKEKVKSNKVDTKQKQVLIDLIKTRMTN